MTFVEQCTATDMTGARCALAAGHPGAHQLGAAVKPKDSPARVAVTVILVMIVAFLIGAMIPFSNGNLIAIAVGAVIAVLYVVSTFRRAGA